MTSDGVGATAVTLLGDGKLDTLALGQGDPRLVLADDEDVTLAGGEGVVNGVLKVDNVEASIVTLTVGDNTNTTHVATAGYHGNGTGVELDVVLDLASLKVDLDGVVDLDKRVGVTDAVNAEVSYLRGNGGTYQPSRFPPLCSIVRQNTE